MNSTKTITSYLSQRSRSLPNKDYLDNHVTEGQQVVLTPNLSSQSTDKLASPRGNLGHGNLGHAARQSADSSDPRDSGRADSVASDSLLEENHHKKLERLKPAVPPKPTSLAMSTGGKYMQFETVSSDVYF